MAKTLKVTGPLATPYREDGSRVYLYEGTEWPSGLREGETERFRELKLIGDVEDDDAVDQKSAAKKSVSSK